MAKSAARGLYVVATPIGHLGDISLRALEVLASVDLILAEDTRVSRKLLSHYGIETPVSAYHEHSSAGAETAFIDKLRDGASIALVSDAGTPLLSDPGASLVKRCIEAGIPVVPIPGASALLAALVGSGLSDGPFRFIGFLPAKKTERRQALQALRGADCLCVFYEAPHRLMDMLEDAAAVLGERTALVARELTKQYETFQRGTLQSLAAHYGANETPRGEMVVLIAPAEPGAPETSNLDEQIISALSRHRIKDAAQIVAAALGLPKRQVYARALELQADRAAQNDTAETQS